MKMDLSSCGYIILAMGGFLSLRGGTKTEMQFVFRMSMMAIGFTLVVVGFVQTRNWTDTLKKRLYILTPLFFATVLGIFIYQYRLSHGPLDSELQSRASINNGVYENKALGLTVPLPKDWHATMQDPAAAHAKELEALTMQDGSKAGDHVKFGEGDMRILLAVSKEPLNPATDKLIASLAVQVVKVPAISAEKFLEDNDAFARKSGLPLRRINTALETRTIGSAEFKSIKYGIGPDPRAEMLQLVAIRSNLAIMIQTVHADTADKQILERMLQGISFK